jgi:SAM-dependent methyltransferase
MNVSTFFDLFVKELEQMPSLWSYYKFHTDTKSLAFRKAYFCQRLEYIAQQVNRSNTQTWDIGCGYGTTALFLALNGYKVHGTTLEFYINELPRRMEYWSQFGDVSGFTYDYEDLFDASVNRNTFDYIIIQDTLHHLEPLQDALRIIAEQLKQDGKLVVVEENGSNIIQNMKLYKQRGNKRIIEIYDERLQKKILLGNENIRSIHTWKNELKKQGLVVDDASIHYVRAFPPAIFNRLGYTKAIEREQKLWRSNALLKKYFFFGINFTAMHAS